MSEITQLRKLSKKIFHDKKYPKLKKIKNKEERAEALKYLIVSHLKLKYNELETKLSKMKEEKKEVFFPELKLLLVPSKIKLFKATSKKSDFDTVMKLFNEIEKELKHV